MIGMELTNGFHDQLASIRSDIGAAVGGTPFPDKQHAFVLAGCDSHQIARLQKIAGGVKRGTVDVDSSQHCSLTIGHTKSCDHWMIVTFCDTATPGSMKIPPSESGRNQQTGTVHEESLIHGCKLTVHASWFRHRKRVKPSPGDGYNGSHALSGVSDW